MWNVLAAFVLKNRIVLLIILMLSTGFMAWKGSKVKMSYEFSKAIPTDNPKFQDYLNFKKQFGSDGNVIVMGVQTDHFFELKYFKLYQQLLEQIKQIKGVVGIMSIPSAVNLIKNDTTEKLEPELLFSDIQSQVRMDTARTVFENLVFYQGLLYNAATKSYLAAIAVDAATFSSKDRTRVVAAILALTDRYEKASGQKVKISGLPFIRTQVAERIKNEMSYFLIGSLGLAVITLLLFFRSLSSTIISLFVVIMGVLWSLGTMQLMGYQISLLTALIPPLIIVIGIPNCIYFLNKYHMSWNDHYSENPIQKNAAKRAALHTMISKMGVVTLFCNIAAAIGFAVFALTRSELLREFGVVAGINIMALFFISFIFIPTILSFLPPPKERHTKYLRNRFLERMLVKLEYWVLRRKRIILSITTVLVLIAGAGIMRLHSIGYIVDDLPKNDKIYTDLKWFEQHFGGVMPLEIVVDTKKKNGITNNIHTIEKIDELSTYIAQHPSCARPLSLVEGLKFAKQAYYNGDSTQYTTPNEFDMAFLGTYLKVKGGNGENTFTKLVKTFIDSTKQRARISVNIADIGTAALPKLLDTLAKKSGELFDSNYIVTYTGGSITYLEGSRFIIAGLKESILWAFLLIALCMLYLFRSLRILLCSLIPNLVPLIITAGLMGWVGIPLKPSTVLIFSIALGIAIDITIRFLVNYKQELASHHHNVLSTTIATIKHTGISIIYTSLVLIAGFVIFCCSSFGGTMALGWLTSFTLLIATFTNLVFLPVILIGLMGKNKTH